MIRDILAGFGAWCLCALLGAAAWAAFRHRKPPAPAARPRRVPGHAPAPGQRHPEGAAPSPPVRPAPVPGHPHHPAARLLTARFFTDGCVLVWDATGNLTHQFEAGDSDRDWDGWLQEMTDDQR